MLLRRHYDSRINVENKEVNEPKVVLEDLTVIELKDLAKDLDLEGYYKMNKSELIENLRK